VFNTPEDRIVWDVGHQTYPHKILTGRRDAMRKLRQADGISGFPPPQRVRVRRIRHGPFVDFDFGRPRGWRSRRAIGARTGTRSR